MPCSLTHSVRGHVLFVSRNNIVYYFSEQLAHSEKAR